ncbi:Fpg/Nei family DNA glycosylase [Cellulomonas sp. McL0617]|uniref:Fpg/Nei family DNA glycosylase n=1 Tax=Cellulomonas sp. McL0617 TaxID=3415675 RepID=UPI003CF49E91
MPEGHTVHRIARQLGLDLIGRRLAVSSPQGRFAAGARRLDGQVLVASRAVGKQLFLEFESGDVLRVHLGLYGAWDFFGRLTPLTPGVVPRGSMGAPRLRRAVRMGEDEREVPAGGPSSEESTGFPPAPVGQVRVRLASAETVADLRGPSACEVLDPAEAAAVVARLGPDPAADLADWRGAAAGGDASASVMGAGPARDVMVDRLTSRSVAVGQLLMDQTVVAGIGNIYRAELLFRARLDPHTPGRRVPTDVAGALWDDWALLLADGIRTGVIVTRDLSPEDRSAALTDPTRRNWVYHRTGLPCLVSGTPVVVEVLAGRNLYWCPTCQQ